MINVTSTANLGETMSCEHENLKVSIKDAQEGFI